MLSIARLAEERLNDRAHVVLVDPRLLQRAIKAHRGATGTVPHTRCYAVRREALPSLLASVPLDVPPDSQRPWLLLVATPTSHEARADDGGLPERVVRAAFHALVHAELEDKHEAGSLDEVALRARIRRIGPADFQEIRSAFRHDDVLLPPGSDREVYVEFCATYLELREFAPALLVTTFPGLVDHDAIDRVIAEDVAVEGLLRRPTRGSTPPLPRLAAPPTQPAFTPLSDRAARRLLRRAQRAERRELLGRAAILASQACAAAEPLRAEAEAAFEEVLGRFSTQLAVALGGAEVHDEHQVGRLHDLLALLCARRPRKARLGRAAEDRVLFALQRAVRAFHQPGVIVDVSAWIRSLGRRPVVRPRDAARELQVARCLAAALEQSRGAGLVSAERATVTACLEDASRRAEMNVRRVLRPLLVDVLRTAGLAPSSGPEQQACSKLMEELLDQIIERGFLALPQLRDAVSRNAAKLGDVSARAALLSGDALLRADAQLERVLDGIYRRGDVYVRGLQKASSLAFGSRTGRAITLWLLLPALGAFTVLEGVRLLFGPLFLWLGSLVIQPLSWLSFAPTALAIVALVHSEQARVIARQTLEVIGVALAWVFFRLPRALLRLPLVQRWLARPIVRSVLRGTIVPALLAALACFVVPLPTTPLGMISAEVLRIALALSVFLVASLTMTSRIGWWLENIFVDHVAPTWQALSRHWLPELVRLIGRAFATAMEGFDRTIRSVDDALRFRRTPSRGSLVVAATVGVVWGAAAYVARLYVTLLVEPEINPLKHFPVVTVAHKLTLPFLPDLLRIMEQAFSIFGPIIGGAIAGVTVFLLPSVFGFLAWELKENYRLYRATRPKFVSEARLGPDGETMHGLLIPGIHSGTLPKLYDRLRRAAQRREAQSSKEGARSESVVSAQMSPELGRFRERLHGIEKCIRRFAERELLPALAMVPGSRLAAVRCERVDLSANRIRISLTCTDVSEEACELTFEHIAGWVVARVSRPGFLQRLDVEQATLFENALAIFYHRAEVSLVREQLDAELGSDARYDIVEDGVSVWPGEARETELFYKLRRHRPKLVAPSVRGKPWHDRRKLDTRRVLYAHQRVAWDVWERTWAATREQTGGVSPLRSGPTILPNVG